jgi:peptidoglycan/LPS O-acetylase OafA/YrhL
MALEAPPIGAPQTESKSPASGRSAASRVDYLDGLRGLACLLVVIYHCYTTLHWHLYLPLPGHFDLASLEFLGYTGVNLFLVLSGICLFLPVVRKDGILNVRDFAIRRCWRIIPPYYAALIVVLLYIWVARLDYRPTYYIAALATHFLFIHNLFYAYTKGIIGPAWTLALEAQWYVVFPLLVVAYRLFPPRWVLLSTLLVSAAFRVAAIPLFHPTQSSSVFFSIMGSLPSRIFEFSLGMFIAGYLARPKSKEYRLTRWDWVWLAAAAAQILWLAYVGLSKIGPRTWPFTDAAYGILFAGLTLLAAKSASAAYRVFTSKAAMWLGTISYSIYLIHLPVINILAPRLARFANIPHANFLLGWFVLLPIAILCGWIFYLLFERPTLLHLQKVRAAQRQKPALAAAEEASDLSASP